MLCKPLQRYGRFLFFKTSAVSSLVFRIRLFEPPMKNIWWSLSLCKFGLNLCSSFNNMQVLIFRALGLKMPIQATIGGVLGKKLGNQKIFVVLSL